MGDRYYLTINCVYCNEPNPDVYYAPTCSIDVFKCRRCNKRNFITLNFKAKKIEDVKLKDVQNGFEENTMGILCQKEIDKCCKDRLRWIKKEIKEE